MLTSHVQLDFKQQQALNKMLAGENVFLTGYAGTGKSTVLNAFREISSKNMVFLAPTGLAALNINGCTFHRFFSLNAMPYFPNNYTPHLPFSTVESMQEISALVVDEISMVGSDLFALFERLLRMFPLPNCGGKIFGGRQIIVAGDYCQLPPVVKCENEDQRLFFEQLGIYAFQTAAWMDGNFQPVFLTEIHRQNNNSVFADILNDIRIGRTSPSYPVEPERRGTGLEALNASPNIIMPPYPSQTILCMTRDEASKINDFRESKIPGPFQKYNGSIQGKFDCDYLPSELVLRLKVGSRVMITANLGITSAGDLCVNGDVGTVVGMNHREVDVALDKGGYIRVEPKRWAAYDYAVMENPIDGSKTVEPVEIGCYVQIPLRHAHALTIHKCQGLSLDAVHLSFGNGAFTTGQTYVALSRCRSLKGLTMSRYIHPQDILVDPVVLEFDRYCRENG